MVKMMRPHLTPNHLVSHVYSFVLTSGNVNPWVEVGVWAGGEISCCGEERWLSLLSSWLSGDFMLSLQEKV